MSNLARPDVPLAQIFAGVDYSTRLPASFKFSGLSSDSRTVRSGDAFVCLPCDGQLQKKYITQAISSGARAVVLDSASNSEDSVVEEGLVLVDQLDRNLSRLAGNYFQHPATKTTIAGVTGTNGKSSVCHWVEELFTLNDRLSGSIGTLGVHACGEQIVEADGMTTRDAIRAQEVLALCVQAGVQTLAMEVSSHGLAQYRVEDIQFSVAVFTNFSRDHLDYHGSELEYWEAKKRLFSLPGVDCAVLNIDDEKGRELASELAPHMRVIKFSAEGDEQADLYLTEVSQSQGFRATLNLNPNLKPHFPKKGPEGMGLIPRLTEEASIVKSSLRLPNLSASFELSNLLAAISAVIAMGLTPQLAIAKCGELQPARGRMQLAATLGDTRVYVDYAHTPEAVGQVLSALAKSGKNLIVVLGCGGDRDLGKRPLMTRAALKYADQLIITSDNPRSEDPKNILRDMLVGLESRDSIKSVIDREEAIRFAIETAPNSSCIAILGKGHEAIQIVGDEEYRFDDVAVAAKVVAGLTSSLRGVNQ